MDAQLVTHLLDQWPIQGIDLSKWNDRPGNNFLMDPKVLLRGGYRFACIKISQGLEKDPRFDAYWKILRETFIEVNGMILRIDRFAYPFVDYSPLHYDSSVKGGDTAWGIKQARFVASILKPDPGEIPPYIDLESNAAWFMVNFWNCRPVMNIAYAMVNELSMNLGYLAGIYSNQGMYPYFGSAMKNYDQWLSWYNDWMTSKKNIDAVMTKYAFKRGWKFLQHASDGDVDNNGTPDGLSMGVDSTFLDLNIYNGDEESYERYKSSTPVVVIPTNEDPAPLPIPGEGMIQKLPVPAFSQKNLNWSSIKLGTSAVTIGSHGCLVTDVASICKYFGKVTDPGQLNRDLIRIGGYESLNLLSYDAITKIYPDITMDWTQFLRDAAVTEAGIEAVLTSRRPVIAQVDYNPATAILDQHWVVLIGKDASGWIMMDPIDGSILSFKSRYSKVLRTIVYNGTPVVVIPPTEDPVIIPPPDVVDVVTKTIAIKKVISPVSMRSAPMAGNTNTVYKVMPVGTTVECLERIQRPGEIWWRIGQGQFCAELYNGFTYLR